MSLFKIKKDKDVFAWRPWKLLLLSSHNNHIIRSTASVPLIFVSFENSSRPSSAVSLYLSFLSHSFRVTTRSLKASPELLLLCLLQTL
jgi:hypothetical protein